MASLQSPSQLFSSGSLSALISAQLDQTSAGATQAATDTTQAAATQDDTAQATDSQGAATQSQSASSGVHHHHHHGGGSEISPAQAPVSPSSVDQSAASSTSDAETEMAQLLTGT